MTRWIGWILIAFAMISVLVLVIQEQGRATVHQKAIRLPEDHRIIVYYLYDRNRCEPCYRIESFTKDAVKGSPQTPLPVDWKPLCTDEPQFAYLVHRYRLIAKSVIVSEVNKGQEIRWKNLDRIWDLTDDRARFIDYIQSEVSQYQP